VELPSEALATLAASANGTCSAVYPPSSIGTRSFWAQAAR